ncbi:MAG: ABC transporter ATP-binding protein, partial [Pseudomonadota bacterium]|nr:ABC transporter ATP-binding protein [Pseudomonadota bacterium]
RSFLDNVVTSTLVFEQPGQVNEYVGGYQDWLRQRPQSLPVVAKSNAVKTAKAQPDKPKSRNKLTYNQQRELAQLPERIEALETELEQVHALVSQADFYRRDAEYINQTLTRLKTLETELHTSYTRWEQLESQTDS